MRKYYHAQLMRMENLFEEIESKVLKMLNPGSDILSMISLPNDENLDAKSRLASTDPGTVVTSTSASIDAPPHRLLLAARSARRYAWECLAHIGHVAASSA